MVEISDYVWVFIVLALLLVVCCCATMSKSLRNNPNEEETPGETPNSPNRRTRTTAPPRTHIVLVDSVYTPPSPGIRPDDYSAPPLYIDDFQSPFIFDNPLGPTGTGASDNDVTGSPPSYDDVMKYDARRNENSTTAPTTNDATEDSSESGEDISTTSSTDDR